MLLGGFLWFGGYLWFGAVATVLAALVLPVGHTIALGATPWRWHLVFLRTTDRRHLAHDPRIDRIHMTDGKAKFTPAKCCRGWRLEALPG